MIDKTKALLEQLTEELKDTGELDQDTRKLLHEIQTSLQDDPDSIVDRVHELEARFAAQHPTAERITRMIIDSLGKMGI